MNSKVFLSNFLSNPDMLSQKHDEVNIDFAKNNLILLTPAGTLVGEPVSDTENFSTEDNPPEEYAAQIIFSTIQSKMSDGDEFDNPTLLLRNVTLFNGAPNPIKYAYLYVFLNDIIGITIGNV